MKVSIRKMAGGGGMTPFTYYKPVMVNNASTPVSSTASTSSTKASSSGTGKSNELTDKDLLNMLGKIDGLPSDMNVIFNNVSNLYASLSSLPGLSSMGNTLSASTLANRYIQTLHNVKLAAFNKKEYDNAYKLAVANNTLNEIAITDLGKIVAMDSKGEIKQLTIDQFKTSEGLYLALTNSNLLKLRADNKPMDNSILSFVLEAVSMDTVNKYIKESMQKLGTSKSDLSGYSQNKEGLVLKGVEFLQTLPQGALSTMTLDGLYKTNYVNETLLLLAKMALDYIFNTMPLNMKTLLSIKSDGTENGAKNLIGSIIGSGVSESTKINPTMIEDGEGKKPGTKASAGSEGAYTQDAPSMLLAGYGAEKTFTIANGTTDGIQVKANTLPLTKGNQALGLASLTKIVSSDYGGVMDWNSVSMGGEFVNNAGFERVLCTDGLVYTLDMPIDMLEYAKSGKIKPDLKGIADKEKADEEVRAAGLWGSNNYQAINEIYAKHNIPAKYDASGKIQSEHWARFGVMNGVATNKAFNQDLTFSNLLSEVNDDNKIEGYLNAFNADINVKETAKSKIEFDKASWWDNLWGRPNNFISSNDSMYEGTIFVPLKENEFNAAAGSGLKIKPSLVMDIAKKLIASDVQNNYVNPGNSL